MRTLATATGSVNFTNWLRRGGGLGHFLTLGRVNVLYDLEMVLHVSKMVLLTINQNTFLHDYVFCITFLHVKA